VPSAADESGYSVRFKAAYALAREPRSNTGRRGLLLRRKVFYHGLAHEHYGIGHPWRIFHDGSFDPIPKIDPTQQFEVNRQSVRLDSS